VKSHDLGHIQDHVTSGKIHDSLSNEATPLDPLDDSYSEQSQAITRYLITLKRPKGILRAEFRKLSREARGYSIRDRLL
jgi:ribosomal protein L19E